MTHNERAISRGNTIGNTVDVRTETLFTVPMTTIHKAAAGRAWRTRCIDPEHPALRSSWEAYLPPTTSRVHLTDGTPYSRTGRNVKALCGATVWPNEVPDNHPARVCAECRRRHAEGPTFA